MAVRFYRPCPALQPFVSNYMLMHIQLDKDLPRVVRQTLLPLIAHHYAIVIVADGSPGDTFAYFSDLPVFYLRHPVNLGQGAALQTGMEFAKRQGATYVVHFDADGQHPAAGLSQLLAPLRRNS